jgi:hypothetical protein
MNRFNTRQFFDQGILNNTICRACENVFKVFTERFSEKKINQSMYNNMSSFDKKLDAQIRLTTQTSFHEETANDMDHFCNLLTKIMEIFRILKILKLHDPLHDLDVYDTQKYIKELHSYINNILDGTNLSTLEADVQPIVAYIECTKKKVTDEKERAAHKYNTPSRTRKFKFRSFLHVKS